MEFRILGPLEVISDGQTLELGGAKQRCLLAMLLLHANEVVSADRLIDALWEDDPPESAQKALQVHVSGLRKVLGKDRVVTRGAGYLLRVEEDELDVFELERLRSQARPAEALSLWRGRPLADLGARQFAEAEIARLDDVRLACLEDRIDQDLRAGRHTELTGELESLVQEHPLRERLRAQQMLALYRSGRQAEALAAYQDGRRALVDELGIEPGRELRELHQTILRQDPALELERRAPATADVHAGAGFVGREPELAELASGLDDAFAGRGRLFLLHGDPGIGKSRLADELIGRAKACGAGVLVGRCWEAGGAPAYWPWTQSLRAYVRATQPGVVRRQLGSHAADVAQIVPDLRELFSGLPEPRPELSDSDAARFRLFDSTASFLRSASAEQPLVLVLDDLHAADEPSLLLLRYVASALGDSRILIVGTFRDLDPTVQDPLESTVAELGRVSATRRIRLAGLSREEVGRLAELTASAVPPDPLVSELYAETEGNPLFVSEIVRLLAAEGRLESAASGRMPIPETIREAIGRRLRTLSSECTRVLSLGSVFGREFGLVALERAADYTGIDRLLSVLDEAIRVRVVEPVPGSGSLGRLRFGHALTREVLYEEIPATHRARLHRRVAEVLEELYAVNPEPHLAELAHHFSLAVPAASPEKAIEYGKRAGDRALAGLAFEEAARLYRTTLAALYIDEAADQRMRCTLLLALGEAEGMSDRLAAKEVFLEAASIARHLDLAGDLARAAAGYGGRIPWARAGDDDRLVPLLEEGLAALGDDDVELRARLLARLAGALRDERARDRREALSGEALQLARRSGNPAGLAYALDGRAAAIIAPDTVEECLALGTELCDVAERMDDRERLVAGLWVQSISLVMAGRMKAATQAFVAVREIAADLNQPVKRYQACAAEAMFALAAGRLLEAPSMIDEAFAIGERAQPEMAIPIYWLQRYTLADFHGQLEDVEPGIEGVVAGYPARPVFRCARCYLRARIGKTPEANQELDDLTRDDASALPFDQEWLYGMSLLAETCALLGNGDAAPALYRSLLPWSELNAADVYEGIRGSVGRYLALLASTMSHWDDAARHFEAGLEMNERMGARPWLAFTQEDYARMLLERGHRRDGAHARELLDQALATYRELGMEPHAARAAALARGALNSSR
jgi:DNA-binding SARP family transcriptional activator